MGIIVQEPVMGLLVEQSDLITFASLIAFILCAAHCVVLGREEGPERRWMSFFSFHLFQGLGAFWILVSPVLPGRLLGGFAAPALQLLSFGSLFSFASAPSANRRRKGQARAVVLILMTACFAAGLLFGIVVLSALASVLLAIPGVAFGVRFLLSDRAVRSHGRPWMVSHSATLALFGLLMVATAAGEVFIPGRAGEGLQVSRMIVSLALAVSLSAHAWRSFERSIRGFGRPLARIAIRSAYLALPLVVVFGAIVTVTFGQRAAEELRSRYDSETNVVRSEFMSMTAEMDRDAALMAGSPQVVAFLARPDASARAAAEVALNMFAETMRVDSYLLDVSGNALASSGSLSRGMFFGVSHANAPYIKDALSGVNGRYFLVDPATHERRYCASFPVWGPRGAIVGVALIMWNIPSDFLRTAADEEAFVVDSSGVIFLSRRPELNGRALWPGSAKGVDSAQAAPQGASVSFQPLLHAEPGAGAFVLWRGAWSIVSRAFLYIPGWSVAVIGPSDKVLLYRLAGLLATLVVLLVITMFSAAGQLSLFGEARIQRSESRYRALVEGSPDWISIVDSSGAFLFTNRAGRAGFGDKETAPGSARSQNLLGPAHVAQIASCVGDAARTGIVSFETTLPAGDGASKVWRITLVPLPPAGNELTAILIGSDITEMRQAEARLLRAERLAALGTLAAGVAHQFNNINAVALGYVQVLESEEGMPDRVKVYLRGVREALERAVDITTHLLPLSVSPSVGEARVLLCDAVRSASASLGTDLAGEGVTLDLALEDAMPVMINRQQLDFIVDAVLSNARHAVRGQPVRRILVQTGTLDAQSFLRVRDSGIGIAPERLSSLFTPFFSEKGEHAPPGSPQAGVRGVGLSLAVSHSIVTGKGGRIEAESAPGVGSTFTVWLPAE